MIKVKDGYGKLIGTTYKGSATQVLLSNGGNLEFSSGTKANTLVQRNANQHVYATYFNSAISDEALSDIGSVYVRNTSDTFIRRISKTQFYSIIDNKFVTLDTAQTITGVKTFSTGPILANNATITQNQNSTSNYTIVVKWLKGGTSQGTYNPSIGQHNTGGDGNGSICILPYPTATSPWGGTVGLFISKGVLKLDGKSVALAENYYTKTESDERYVNVTGDTMTGPLIVKAAITGTQLISTIATGTSPLKVTSTTVVTNLNSDLLDGLHETSFFRARGSQSIASSIPTTTELSTNNNLCGSWNVSYTGASGHLVQFNTGSGSTRYMQFYSMYSGSLYWRNSTDSTLNTKSWKTIVDSANYTGIVLKIGTATKGSATLPIYLNAGTPTACSTTLGVSITGNAATATKLQTARTINGTSFNGTANIVTAYWGTARTISLSGAVTGSASVNGSQNVTITTTYQTGSIDGRYVGGNKTANHGSSGTAYTADSYSSTFARKEFVAFAERGSWAYANNGYVTTDTGVNIPLAGTAVFQWGASDTNKTQLYITPYNNSRVSNPAANEMLFYTSNGSGYTSAWTRVLTHRNYTNYTVTKTGGGASGTWGISITGNAATATTAQYLASNSRMDYGWNGLNYFNINGTAGTAVKANNTPTTAWWHILRFNHANSSGYYTDLAVPFNANSLYYKRVAAGALVNGKWVRILDELNYTSYVNPANFVTALGTNGNYLTWTKNGKINNLTVPFATTSNVLNNLGNRTAISGTTVGQSGLRLYRVYNNGYPVTYGNVLNIGGSGYGELLFQWTGDSNPGHLYYRSKRDVASQAWSNWVTILDNNNYSSTLDGRYVTLTTNQTVSGIKTFSKQQKFTVATGTSPFTVSSTTVVSNLNADMLDSWHLSYILKDGYVTSGTSGLSSYWRKVWDITLNNQYNDVDINLLVHSAYNQQWGIISFRLRQNGTGTAKNIGAYLAEVVGNIPTDRFRLYYNNSSGLCQLWCNPGGQYGVYNYRVLAKTWRTGTEATTLGTFYTGNTTTAQALPSDSYVSMTGIAIVNTAAKVANTLTFSAGKFSSKTYNGSVATTVNIPTHFSHLTNDNKNLVIKFNGGTTEGTNMFTYNGSSAKSPNITLTAIGSGLLHNSLTVSLANTTSNSGWSMINSSYNGFILKSIRTQASAPSWILGNYSAGICFGGADTKGVISCAYNTPSIRFAGGNSSKPVWWMGITGSSGATYNLANMWTGTRYWANIAVSTASSTGTKPTFNTCYTSNWFRSTGNTGWYSESYGGGWYMTDSTWLRAYNGKAIYTSNAGSQAFNAAGGFYSSGSGGNGLTIIGSESTTTRIKGQIGSSVNTAVARYEVQWYSNYARFDVHRGSSTDISKWSFKYNSTEVTYLTTGGHLYANGFHHRSMDSNSYVLLAGGSYKSLADFAKGNAGSATKGVYVTGGTVKAMTYSLNANLNSGTSGKLAYYSSATTVTSYSSSIGSTHQPIYMNAGVPTICSYYSFLGASQQPIVLVTGYFYRSSTTSTSWYFSGYKHSQIGSPSFYVRGGVMRLQFSNTTSIMFSSACAQGRRNFWGSNTSSTQAYDGSSGNYEARSEGAYWFNSYTSNSGNTSYLYIRAYRLANADNDSWYTGDMCWKNEQDAIESVAFTVFGYIYH